ncbi:MAG: ABC-ATPase UvrA [Planctomycetes bacterium]|nr:ABC-ATPase UvrA [Planctomycetota bacterium]
MSRLSAITETQSTIRVRGARVHNLQNIDLEIPRGKFVVVTGVSGSGKSSLAFDTLFAEGQRRYLETLSSQTRTYLDQMQRADVDEIEGLPPTLSVEQHVGQIHPRSTLATTTGIHEFLRLLYARAGTAHCPQCRRELSQQSPQAIVDAILELEAGRKAMILAPLVRGKKGQHKDLFEKICREGFVRARVDGEIVDAGSPPPLKKSQAHDIDVVIDRIVVKDGLRARLQESVNLALRQGQGSCVICHETPAAEGTRPNGGSGWQDRLYSSRFACPSCQLSFAEIEPRTFSFNSPYGACSTCEGLGLVDGAQASGGRAGRKRGRGQPALEPAEADCVAVASVCPDCKGARLAPIGREVTVAGVSLPQLLALSVADAESAIGLLCDHLSGQPAATGLLAGSIWKDLNSFTPAARLVAERVLPEIHQRLRFLREVGVHYLSLDRPTQTLSGGEFQRARIAGCLGGGLIGVCYILDEPTIGLHARDTERLLQSLVALRDQGNSLIVVEHDREVMLRADYLIDLGPGAGREGGRVMAVGTPADVSRDPQSLTGRYLQANGVLPDRVASAGKTGAGNGSRTEFPSGILSLSAVTSRNLQEVSATFPLGQLTCVTGVSGSGKSTLVMETLVPKLRAVLAARPMGRPGAAATRSPRTDDRWPGILTGADQIDRLVEVDQSPLGRNARSNPATVSGLWDEIRKLYARTRDARVRGFRAARFSFNAAGGRCEECRGQGTRRVAMQFLPDIEVVCPTCRGARFNRQTLQIKFRGKSVADVLEMRIDEAVGFFHNFAGLQQKLQTFVDVGLGYLALGQSATTLSGGEVQRIKLASELGRSVQGRSVYVLDEPTTGLHPADIERLLDLFQKLTAAGHTVIVVEHQLDVIARSDWVIDLGPEGGAEGGHLVGMGTPADIAAQPASHTGRALRSFLGS